MIKFLFYKQMLKIYNQFIVSIIIYNNQYNLLRVNALKNPLWEGCLNPAKEDHDLGVTQGKTRVK